MLPKLKQDKVYPTMWRVKWPDGELSDMVNKTRAKDAIARYLENKAKVDSRRAAKCPTEPAGAFKSESGV